MKGGNRRLLAKFYDFREQAGERANETPVRTSARHGEYFRGGLIRNRQDSWKGNVDFFSRHVFLAITSFSPPSDGISCLAIVQSALDSSS